MGVADTLGYSKSEDKCEKCGSFGVLPFTVAAIFAVAGLLALAFAVNKNVLSRAPSSGFILSLASIMCSAVQTLGVFSHLAVTWSEPLGTILGVLSLASFKIEFVRFDCVVGNEPAVSYGFRQAIGPIMVALIFVILLCKKCFKPATTKVRIELINTMGSAASLLFISFLVSAVSPIICYDHPGDIGSSMLAVPSILCFQTEEHLTMLAMGIVGLFLMPIPFLVVVLYGVAKYPSWVSGVGSAAHLRAFRFLFFRFTPNRYFFATILYFRSTLICFVPVLIHDLPAIQLCTITAILGGFIRC